MSDESLVMTNALPSLLKVKELFDFGSWRSCLGGFLTPSGFTCKSRHEFILCLVAKSAQ